MPLGGGCRPGIFLVLGFKPKFRKVQAIYKEINKAQLNFGIDMLITGNTSPTDFGVFFG